MFDISILGGGEFKSLLPPLLYVGIELSMLALITLILSIPPSITSTSTKQLCVIPPLLMLLLFPSAFSIGNMLVEFSTPTINFVAVLKCLDLFYATPLQTGKPIHTTPKQLFIDMFDFLYNFSSDKQEKKPLKKDQKSYHLVFYIIGYWLAIDVMVNWFSSFSGREVVMMEKDRPFLFFVYYAVVGTVMHCTFNVVGYAIQLMYCILTAQLTYSSVQWNSISKFPLFSKNLTDLWTNRWHKMFKKTWLSFPFKPVYHLSKQLSLPKAVSYLLASLSVFLISGTMHEYIIAVNISWPFYWRYFKGEQIAFFMLQGLGVVFEQLVKKFVAPQLPRRFKESWVCDAVQRVWGLWFVYSTFRYFARGFVVSDFHLNHSVRMTTPFLKKLILAHPILKPYFGNHIQ